MTGWRLGWMVHPQHLVEPMAVLAECNNTGATVFAQYGGIAALEEGEAFVAEFNARCRRNAALVMEMLGAHPRVQPAARRRGPSTPSPRSRASPTAWPSRAACWPRPRSASPPATPSAPGNEDHVRLCFAIATERLEEALRRLIGVLDQPQHEATSRTADSIDCCRRRPWHRPAGEWVTEGDKARVRIAPCAADAAKLCGTITWSYRPPDAPAGARWSTSTTAIRPCARGRSSACRCCRASSRTAPTPGTAARSTTRRAARPTSRSCG